MSELRKIICPLCDGRGKMLDGFYVNLDGPFCPALAHHDIDYELEIDYCPLCGRELEGN